MGVLDSKPLVTLLVILKMALLKHVSLARFRTEFECHQHEGSEAQREKSVGRLFWTDLV